MKLKIMSKAIIITLMVLLFASYLCGAFCQNAMEIGRWTMDARNGVVIAWGIEVTLALIGIITSQYDEKTK
jgi:hypothetical protein